MAYMCAKSNSEVLHWSFLFLDLVGAASSINQVIVFCLVSGRGTQIKGSTDHYPLDTSHLSTFEHRLYASQNGIGSGVTSTIQSLCQR